MKEHVTIGKILNGSEQRDAVHIAIAPVVAAHTLSPGMHVGVLPDGRASCNYSETAGRKSVGIVDPYLTADIKPDEWFYLFLYPNTVTSLRHEWTHPAFGPSFPPAGSKLESEQWLMAYARKSNCYDTPEKGFARLVHDLRNGDLRFYGSSLYGPDDLDDADELKRHAEAYLGIKIDWDKFTFSCSC